MAKTRDFAAVIRRRLSQDKELARLVEEESLHADVATAIYKARTSAGLTQAQLAKRAGTQQSVVARLESTDYEGHSLSMLRRIAQALNKQLRLEFVEIPGVNGQMRTRRKAKSRRVG
jgi:transcriptional regulator with XRE-family HTH domain